MKYERIIEGIFKSRPNRFVANVEIDGAEEVCHVKNTGRCKEIFLPDTRVYVQRAENSERKTKFDLIAAEKGNRIINVDSQAPNEIFAEWAAGGGIPKLTHIKGEQRFGSSRLDFYMEAEDRKIYAEVKGVTLEESGRAMFPDAPTQRGVKHLYELCSCIEQGMEAWAVFIIQMDKIRYFTPNDAAHPEFGEALRRAGEKGVQLLALECDVTCDSIKAVKEVPIKL